MSTIEEIEAGWTEKGVWVSFFGRKVMTFRRRCFLLATGIGCFVAYCILWSKDVLWGISIPHNVVFVIGFCAGICLYLLYFNADNHRQLLNRKLTRALKALEEHGINLDD